MSDDAARPGRIVNRTGLAEVFGKSVGTVDAWVRAGMPVVMRGGRGEEYSFDTGDCLDWLLSRERRSASGNADDPRRRSQNATAELKEMQVAERRRTLVHVDAVARSVEARLSVVKSRLMALPGRIASKLHDPAVSETVADIAKAEVIDALTELSAPAVVADAQAG